MSNSDEISYNGYKIDRPSQRMLLYLYRNGPSEAKELCDWVGVNQNQQIHYRADEYLIPAGLVKVRPQHTNHEWAPLVYALTERGRKSFEDGNGLELMDTIRTVEDVMAATEEAAENASSAKQSVQNYRRKIYDMNRKFDNKCDDLESELAALKTDVSANHPTHQDVDTQSYRAARDVHEETIATVEGLLTDLREELISPNDVEPLEGRVSELEDLLENARVEMITRIESTESRITELEGRVADIEEKQKSGWLRR
jgi:polyhydroxyalkanoate synthesis regulator phasin